MRSGLTVTYFDIIEINFHIAFLLSPGNLNGAVTIWDHTKQMIRHLCYRSDQQEETDAAGVTKMIWVKNHLLTGCLDGAIRIYEGNSGTRSSTLTGHKSEVLDLCYNSQANVILTTSDDGTARIFKFEA